MGEKQEEWPKGPCPKLPDPSLETPVSLGGSPAGSAHTAGIQPTGR